MATQSDTPGPYDIISINPAETIIMKRYRDSSKDYIPRKLEDIVLDEQTLKIIRNNVQEALCDDNEILRNTARVYLKRIGRNVEGVTLDLLKGRKILVGFEKPVRDVTYLYLIVEKAVESTNEEKDIEFEEVLVSPKPPEYINFYQLEFDD
jgi:hypothetical protein